MINSFKSTSVFASGEVQRFEQDNCGFGFNKKPSE